MQNYDPLIEQIMELRALGQCEGCKNMNKDLHGTETYGHCDVFVRNYYKEGHCPYKRA